MLQQILLKNLNIKRFRIICALSTVEANCQAYCLVDFPVMKK